MNEKTYRQRVGAYAAEILPTYRAAMSLPEHLQEPGKCIVRDTRRGAVITALDSGKSDRHAVNISIESASEDDFSHLVTAFRDIEGFMGTWYRIAMTSTEPEVPDTFFDDVYERAARMLDMTKDEFKRLFIDGTVPDDS